MDGTRANNLYDAGFRSLDALKNADIKELKKIDFISPTTARKIKQYLHESVEVSGFEYLEESQKDREKFAMKFGENPGRLLLKFRHSSGFKLIPQIMLIGYFIAIGMMEIFIFLIFPNLTPMLLIILIPLTTILIIFLYVDYQYWNLDFIRIYEQGILLSRRKEGVYSNPPTTYWGFVLSPVWQTRFGYRYIPKKDVIKVYPIYVNGRFMGFNIIDTHGRWINSNFMFIYKDHKNRLNEILENLEIIFGSRWETICKNTVEFKIPWGIDFRPE